MSRRAYTESWQRFAGGVLVPVTGFSGATPTPDAGTAESWVWTMNSNVVVGAPANPRAIGDMLYLVFIQDGGSRTISWNAVYRNAPTPSAGAAGTRISAEFRFDGVSWQFVGGSTAFA